MTGENTLAEFAKLLINERGFAKKADFARRCETTDDKIRFWTTGVVSPRLYDAANVLDKIGWEIKFVRK